MHKGYGLRNVDTDLNLLNISDALQVLTRCHFILQTSCFPKAGPNENVFLLVHCNAMMSREYYPFHSGYQ